MARGRWTVDVLLVQYVTEFNPGQWRTEWAVEWGSRPWFDSLADAKADWHKVAASLDPALYAKPRVVRFVTRWPTDW